MCKGSTPYETDGHRAAKVTPAPHTSIHDRPQGAYIQTCKLLYLSIVPFQIHLSQIWYSSTQCFRRPATNNLNELLPQEVVSLWRQRWPRSVLRYPFISRHVPTWAKRLSSSTACTCLQYYVKDTASLTKMGSTWARSSAPLVICNEPPLLTDPPFRPPLTRGIFLLSSGCWYYRQQLSK